MSTPFWIEDISQLFAFNRGIFPGSNLKLVENMNAISRVALIACIVIAIFRPVLAISTFVVSSVIIIALYYGLSSREGFNEEPRGTSFGSDVERRMREPVPRRDASSSSNAGFAGDLFKAPPTRERASISDFGTNKRRITDDPSEYVSENQMLVGGPNPKTLIPLNNALKNKSHDLDAWRTSELTVHSGINDSNPVFDAYSSGYVARLPGNKCGECFRESCTCMQLAAAKKKLSDYYNLQRDSALDEESLPEIEIIDSERPSTTDVFDPRFTGYGPTDRCYVDEITGQTKYFYDDVDSVRMPPYIGRNNVDVFPWAPKYGPGFDGSISTNLPAESVTNVSKYKGLANVRQNALDAFRISTNNARRDLQESLMRKRNGEMWQLRVAPIH